MPMYEFVCDRCKVKMEMSRSIADRNLVPECPECGKWDKVRRVASTVAHEYKGTGVWHNDRKNHDDYTGSTK